MALQEDDDFATTDPAALDSSWTDDIESTVLWAIEEWKLSIGAELQAGLNGYILEATLPDGDLAVLKLRRPDAAMQHEANALRIFNGHAAARILNYDSQVGALLIERAVPGLELGNPQFRDVCDDVTPALIKTLNAAEPDSSLLDLAVRADRWAWNLENFTETAPLPPADIALAAQRIRALAESQGTQVALHGDLHAGNILQTGRGEWVAIDPKGFVGESVLDAAWWLHDPPADEKNTLSLLDRRLTKLLETLDIDRERLLDWAESASTLVVASRVAAFTWWDAERHAAVARALRELR